MTTPHPATVTRKETSDLMVEFMHMIEKKLGRRLTAEEARSSQFRGDALAYAKTILRWTRKARNNESKYAIEI